jgi:hypothetical protein
VLEHDVQGLDVAGNPRCAHRPSSGRQIA